MQSQQKQLTFWLYDGAQKGIGSILDLMPQITFQIMAK